ncbi:MAG: hypothetical protein K2M54_07815, partial [Muribaculaceae bacterium]|nr:hypothetical protein [Muribaculaceae bacterium]
MLQNLLVEMVLGNRGVTETFFELTIFRQKNENKVYALYRGKQNNFLNLWKNFRNGNLSRINQFFYHFTLNLSRSHHDDSYTDSTVFYWLYVYSLG